MFAYQTLQAPDIKIDTTIIDDIMHHVEDKVEKIGKGKLNIVFISSNEIQALNKQYRNKDSATDVLSFHYYDDFSKLSSDDIAGEIVLCIDKIEKDAKQSNRTNSEQIYMLIIHSVLHILGYDHKNDDDYKIMHTLEKAIYREVLGKGFN